MTERSTTDKPDDDERDDLYGQDSFPASDPPSTWWGASRKAPPAPLPAAEEAADPDTDLPPELP